MLTDKLHYRPSETVSLTGKAPFTANFDLDDQIAVVGNSFTPPEPGGYQVTDSAGNSSVFTVAENVFDVGVGGNFGSDQMTGNVAPSGVAKWTTIPANCVAHGVNLFELFFAAPCDFSQLVGTGAWLSGQARYPENEVGMVGLVQACHAVGVWVGLYVNCHPCGPAGAALAQAHPEFFVRDGFGNIDGGPLTSAADIAGWNTPAYSPASPIWRPLTLDLTNPNVVRYLIDQIKAAVAHYGFDYVRFDGHTTVAGRPNASIENMLALRLGLAGVCRVGFNFGKGGDISSEGAVALAGGGLYLQESGSSAAERSLVNGLGGSYYTITAGDPFAHPYYANLPAQTGMARWTPAQSAFARRWFPKFVWNRDLSPVAAGMRCLVDGAKRYYVTELPTPGTYQLGRSTNIITPETGLETGQTTATIASFGIVVDEFAPVDPAGVIRCPAFRNYSGAAAPIGGDGRQFRSDLSSGVNPFMGVTVGPFATGTYKVSYRLWLEGGSSGGFAFQVQQPGGQPILKASLSLASGGTYQDVPIGQCVVPDGAMLNATCWPTNAKGSAHLDSVSFTPA